MTLFVGAVYALGATLYGRRVAAISAVVVALGPGALLYYGDVTGFGYIEVMLLGTLRRASPPGGRHGRHG